MKRILFQGDSITDGARDEDWIFSWGKSYPYLVEATLGFERPGEFDFVNRGISGNRIVDLYARMKVDILNHKPDYISFLIGVNDVWHELDAQNGVDAKKFEKIYSMLIEEVQEALPNTKIMILEPFLLKGTATENTDEQPDKWKLFKQEVCKRAEIAKAIAEKYHLLFVPLQDKFDEACQLTAESGGSSYWLWDGVHPTPKGHELIKKEWIKAFHIMED